MNDYKSPPPGCEWTILHDPTTCLPFYGLNVYDGVQLKKFHYKTTPKPDRVFDELVLEHKVPIMLAMVAMLDLPEFRRYFKQQFNSRY